MMERRIYLQRSLYAALAKLLFSFQQVRIVLEKPSQHWPGDFACSRERIHITRFEEPSLRILVEDQPVGAQVFAQDLKLLLSPWTAEHLLLAQAPIVPDVTCESSYKLMTPLEACHRRSTAPLRWWNFVQIRYWNRRAHERNSISIPRPALEHRIRLAQVTKWAEGTRDGPAGVLKRQRVKELLAKR